MDFIVELPKSKDMTTIMVIVDRLTKMAHFIPFRCLPTAEIAADSFLTNVFKLHGLPDSIVSDRGSQFTSDFWKRLCFILDIDHSFSTANHPQTDGQTERVNAILEQYLRCYINERQNNWIDLLPFAEFAYTLIQGNDFLELYKTKNCVLQCEGSDQWGNITTGIELIKKKLGKEAYGFTMPLILDANGKKFGKSEGNALWLDINKTSGYELYQYLINSDDSKVEEYLKVFTFLTKEEIEDVMSKHNEAPEQRIAQKELAKQIITDLHGSEEFDKAIRISEALFSGDINNLSVSEIEDGLKDVPSFEVDGSSLLDTLVNNKIASSRREAREFLSSGSITINGEKVSDESMIIDSNIAKEGKLVIIRRGKKKYYLGIVK